MKDEEAVRNRLLEIVEATIFPAVALKVFNLVGNVNTDVNELEKVVSMDPVLSGKVLKIANSSFFCGGRKTTTIFEALSVIGFDAMRTIVITTTLRDLFRGPGELERKLWEHSIGVSIIASVLARETKLAEQGVASLAGLFHDIGKLILKNAFPDAYVGLAKSIDGSVISSFYAAENEVIGTDHSAAGLLLADKWNLPDEYRLVIACHHDCERRARLTDKQKHLLNIVRASDEIALFLGIGFSRKIDSGNLSYGALGFTEETFHDLLWKTHEILEDYKKSVDIL
jgi:putative nucleotidyltransferase with HDIG domain